MLEKFINDIKKFDFSTLKVAVVFGGKFSESAVSRDTAKSFQEALVVLKIPHRMIEFSNNLIAEIQLYHPDVVLNAMHGTFGEDGRLPVLLDFLGYKYTHSGYYPSFCGMQKDIAQILCEQWGAPVIPSIRVDKKDIIKENIADFFTQLQTDKLVIKPNDDGSSVGVVILNQSDAQWNYSQINDSKSEHFLVQKYIDGVEISTPVFFGKAVGSLELSPKSGFYDYKNKYTDGLTEHIFPARISEELSNNAIEYAETAYKALNCSGIARVDFRVDMQNNTLYLLEINTHPGMTKLSIVPDVAARQSVDFQTLVALMIYDAYCK